MYMEKTRFRDQNQREYDVRSNIRFAQTIKYRNIYRIRTVFRNIRIVQHILDTFYVFLHGSFE